MRRKSGKTKEALIRKAISKLALKKGLLLLISLMFEVEKKTMEVDRRDEKIMASNKNFMR